MNLVYVFQEAGSHDSFLQHVTHKIQAAHLLVKISHWLMNGNLEMGLLEIIVPSYYMPSNHRWLNEYATFYSGDIIAYHLVQKWAVVGYCDDGGTKITGLHRDCSTLQRAVGNSVAVVGKGSNGWMDDTPLLGHVRDEATWTYQCNISFGLYIFCITVRKVLKITEVTRGQIGQSGITLAA